MWSVTELLRAYLPDSFYLYVTSTPELLHGKGFTEIVNGTSQLPNTIIRNITENAKSHTAGRTHLQMRMQNGTRRPAEFDSVAFTIPARQVSLVDFYPGLECAKKYALDSFHYKTLVKVFLAFSSPFWARSPSNTILPLLNYRLPTKKGKWNHISSHNNHALSLTQFPWQCSAGFLCLGR